MPETANPIRNAGAADNRSPSRTERLEQFARDRMQRLEKARADRDAELRKAEQSRLEDARGKLAGFEDIAQAARQLERRRKSARRWSALRFAAFVLVPTSCVAVYLSEVATPFYQARASFVVTVPGGSATNNNDAGSLFGAARPGSLQDAFLARAYLMSPDVLHELQSETEVLTVLTGPSVDPVRARRLPFVSPAAPLDTFHRFVSADVDIQQGLTTLRVRAPDPVLAEKLAARMLSLTGDRIETLGTERYSRAIRDARQQTAAARVSLRQARNALAAAQVRIGETDPYARIAVTYEMIFQLERDRQKVEQELALLRLRYGDKNILVQRRAEEAGLIQSRLDEYRTVVNGGGEGPSLAARTASFDQARLDVELAKTTWQERLRSEEATRVAAKRDRPMMTIIVPPHAASTPATPRIAETSLLAFLVLAGVYAFLTILATSLRQHASRS